MKRPTVTDAIRRIRRLEAENESLRAALETMLARDGEQWERDLERLRERLAALETGSPRPVARLVRIDFGGETRQ